MVAAAATRTVSLSPLLQSSQPGVQSRVLWWVAEKVGVGGTAVRGTAEYYLASFGGGGSLERLRASAQRDPVLRVRAEGGHRRLGLPGGGQCLAGAGGGHFAHALGCLGSQGLAWI